MALDATLLPESTPATAATIGLANTAADPAVKIQLRAKAAAMPESANSWVIITKRRVTATEIRPAFHKVVPMLCHCGLDKRALHP